MIVLLPLGAVICIIAGFAALGVPEPFPTPWVSIGLWALAVSQLAAFLPSFHRGTTTDGDPAYEAQLRPSWFASNPRFSFPETDRDTPRWIRVLKVVDLVATVVFFAMLAVLVIFMVMHPR